MSSIRTGTVTGISVVPYDATKDTTNDPNSVYSPYHYNNILDNLKNIKEVIVLNIQDDQGSFPEPERIMDLGITSSWFYALNCLAVRLYDGSVLFASIAVECVLNHDMRLEPFRQNMSYKWIDLNWQNLKHAHEKGLPTDLLLNIGETFGVNMEFVYRRNKVAHGDVEGYHKKYKGGFDSHGFDSDFDLGHERASQEHAIDQMNKAKDFIVAWANQKQKVRLH